MKITTTDANGLEVHEHDENQNIKEKLAAIPFCEGEEEMEYVEAPAPGTFVFHCVCDQDYCNTEQISVVLAEVKGNETDGGDT